MNPDAAIIGLILLGAGQIASIALTFKSLFGSQRREISPSPLEIRAAANFITDRQMKQHEEANDRRASSIEQTLHELMSRMDGLNTSDESRTAGIHRRLNVISINTATLAGRISMLTKQPIELVQEGHEG